MRKKIGTKWEKSVPQDVYVRQSFNLQEFFEVNAAVRRLPSHIPCAYKHPVRSSNTAQIHCHQTKAQCSETISRVSQHQASAVQNQQRTSINCNNNSCCCYRYSRVSTLGALGELRQLRLRFSIRVGQCRSESKEQLSESGCSFNVVTSYDDHLGCGRHT